LQHDFQKTAAALVRGTEKAIATAVAPLLKRIEALEARPAPEKGDRGEAGPAGVGIAKIEPGEGVAVFRLTDGQEHQVPVPAGRDGQGGKDAEPPSSEAIAETFRPMAEEIVSEAVAAGLAKVPPPEKGEKGDQGEAGAAGADGRGWAKSFIDRDGNLVATFTDGSTENLGCIVGKDGQPGRDGFSLQDFDVIPVDERTVELKFAQDGATHSYELVFPVPVYRGVFKEGQAYQRGDMVTWGGSLFHADKATLAKPESEDWRLCVKKGRDGKDAKAA
jgi:hypothetical protein